MNKKTFHTNRLTLRPFSLSDAGSIMAIDNYNVVKSTLHVPFSFESNPASGKVLKKAVWNTKEH